nr:transposase [Actinoallomurus iriomotensis]
MCGRPPPARGTRTAGQLRQTITRLIEAGHRRPGDPDIWVVADAGYDGPRLAHLLKDLPVQVLVRRRSDRVLRRAAPPWVPGTMGRPKRHGTEFVFGDPSTWGSPDVTTTSDTRLYGHALVRAWGRLHPRAPGSASGSSAKAPGSSNSRARCGDATRIVRAAGAEGLPAQAFTRLPRSEGPALTSGLAVRWPEHCISTYT